MSRGLLNWIRSYAPSGSNVSLVDSERRDSDTLQASHHDQTLAAFAASPFANEYNTHLHDVRCTEYPQLAEQTYLDHAGATPYAASVVRAHTADLLAPRTLYGNPHSYGSPSSNATHERISRVRGQIFRHLNADPKDYVVVFTSGATAAAKLVADSLDWARGAFFYLQESHTSIVGIRGVAGTKAKCVVQEELDALCDDDGSAYIGETSHNAAAFNLLAYPAQCNATGTRFPLNYINRIRERNAHHLSNRPRFLSLLDAASFLSTANLDLTAHPADFTILSFYKLFGFPTGVGALVFRRDAVEYLSQKRYFGGGTVDAITVNPSAEPWHVLKGDLASRFEDGTLPFLEIMALEHGFKYLDGVGGMLSIEQHAGALRGFVASEMTALTYLSGEPLCVLYENTLPHGPILNFNLLASNGEPISAGGVLRLAGMQDIHLRAGCFCNPGACHSSLKLSPEDVMRNHEVHGVVCGGEADLVDNGKRATASLRISFGASSTIDDVARWLTFLKSSYLSQPASAASVVQAEETVASCRIAGLTLYPIKSCGPYTPTSWPMSNTGLLLDREWMLVDASDIPLTLKRCPMLARLSIANLDLGCGAMTVRAPDGRERVVHFDNNVETKSTSTCQDTDDWFSSVLETSARLVRAASANEEGPVKNFASRSNLLISSATSFSDLHARIPPHLSTGVTSARLRANITIDSLPPYAEDAFVGRSLIIYPGIGNPGRATIKVDVVDLCTRCGVVNVDPATASSGREPFSTLSRYRNIRGKGVCFGVLASVVDAGDAGVVISVGDKIYVA
ncbi:hypothetical protein HKX48_004950 [Thoreauomyces humboldtii]|nr:hypothetical protein HKX48_004950 [Thoreauomyces humboldtii]